MDFAGFEIRTDVFGWAVVALLLVGMEVLAPEIYLDCRPIGGEPAHPVLGGGAGDAIEYAVRMRRFPQDLSLIHI